MDSTLLNGLGVYRLVGLGSDVGADGLFLQLNIRPVCGQARALP